MRNDMLEAQNAVAASLVAYLVKAHLLDQPVGHRAPLRASLEAVFEHTIAGLLASEHSFPDASVRAVENMRDAMFGAPPR